jgi:hypothetical protein
MNLTLISIKKTWPFIRDEIFLLVLKFENTSRMFKGFNNAYIYHIQGCQKRFFDTTRNIQYKLGS